MLPRHVHCSGTLDLPVSRLISNMRKHDDAGVGTRKQNGLGDRARAHTMVVWTAQTTHTHIITDIIFFYRV